MKRLVIAAALVVAASCSRQSAKTTDVPTDTREPINVAYVTAPELQVHAQPAESAPVIATFQNGEAISIMSKKPDWAEVRTGDRTGWAKLADLGDAAAAKQQNDNPQPRFRKLPSPIASPTAHGEVYLEADVNTDGDVVAVRVVSNTTGSDALAAENASALSSAKFYPIMHNGEKKPFKYYHRVAY